MMMFIPTLLIVLIMVSSSSLGLVSEDPFLDEAYTVPVYIAVDDYGARSNGADDTIAFLAAWEAACSASNGVLIVPPKKAYYLSPITFRGPCRSTTNVLIYGVIRASIYESSYESDPRHWLMFSNVQNLRVEGGGVIDGNGQVWWRGSCKGNRRQSCRSAAAPTAVTFYQCHNLKVSHVIIRNAQRMHLTFQRCTDVEATDLEVMSPEWSPNTDGIHVTETQNITLARSDIRTGDDCISIVTGSQTVIVADITCGPGHGISIGSLGAGNSEGHVSDVYVTRARLYGTTNGVRIKTWQGGHGRVQSVVFEDIEMHNVQNPIIIDQNYCDHRRCRRQQSAVKISDITYTNIRGTSASRVAVKLDCSQSHKCERISMRDINLRLADGRYGAEAECSNVRDRGGMMYPRCR